MPDPSRPPSVDSVMRAKELEPFSDRIRARAAKKAVQSARSSQQFDTASIVSNALRLAQSDRQPSISSAINASGVILHTGLGRSRLHAEAAAAIESAAASHVVLEFDLSTGERGNRQEHVADLLRELIGAEDAYVVNNCAAALVLALAATCAGCEVILSRSEMIEIGGSFRIPEIVETSGCRLVEVGCTNKTRLSDYEKAVSNSTAGVLRCHPSNYRIIGFTESPTISELAQFAIANSLCLIDDVGSGCLIETTEIGLAREHRMQDSIRGGAHLALCSGDKMLGGPQCGIILGNTQLIDRIRTHPLARAFRIDKLCLSGLAATLQLYADKRWHEIPVWKYAMRPLGEVEHFARVLASGFSSSVIESSYTAMGGGSMPSSGIPTVRVGFTSDNPATISYEMRNWPTPIVGRIESGTFWLDPRTIEEEEISTVREAIAEIVN